MRCQIEIEYSKYRNVTVNIECKCKRDADQLQIQKPVASIVGESCRLLICTMLASKQATC